MKRSITRGLSVSAVSALAVTGLSLTVTPAASAAGPEVELLSQFTGFASTLPDGSGTGTRLTALVAEPGAEVTFQVNADPEAGEADPGWREVAAPADTTGRYASMNWDGRDSLGHSYVGERVALRAVATGVDGISYSVRNNVEVVDRQSVESVSLTTTSTPYFTQPYADSDRTSTTIPVSGVTSATSGTVELSPWRDAEGGFAGRTAAEVEPASFKVPGTSEFRDAGRFTGTVELTPFDITEGVVGVGAERGSDDVAPVSLTPQTIGGISASFAQEVPPGDQGEVTVRVVDTDGSPVVGAEVRRLSDGTVVGYTDRVGAVTTTQAGGSTEEYYANATDADGFDPQDGDVQSGPVTVAVYEPVASYVDPVLVDGEAFDVDEYTAGDLAVRVLDQRSRPVGAGESVSYKIYPSDADAPATYRTALTNSDGVAVADFDPTGASGRYTFAAVLTSQADSTAETLRTFTTGEAELLLSPKARKVVAAAGGQIDYFGRLVVDGVPLAGRRVELSYQRGVEVVPGNRPDAGLLTADGRRRTTAVDTNRNGSFRVTVDDRAEAPQASEVGGVLTALTGDTVATDESTVEGNAGAGDTSTTRFGSGRRGTATIVLRGFGNGARADRLRVAGPTTLAREEIKVFRVKARGKRVLVTTRTLNRTGDRPMIRVDDRNGFGETTYVVRLVASSRVKRADSAERVVR